MATHHQWTELFLFGGGVRRGSQWMGVCLRPQCLLVVWPRENHYPWGWPTEDSKCEFTRAVKPLGRIKETLWAVKNWLLCSSLSQPLEMSLWFSSTQETSLEKVPTSDTGWPRLPCDSSWARRLQSLCLLQMNSVNACFIEVPWWIYFFRFWHVSCSSIRPPCPLPVLVAGFCVLTCFLGWGLDPPKQVCGLLF